MKLRHLFAALLLGVLPAVPAHAGFSITIAPPPIRVYEQPLCPTEGYLWTPGYWAYDYDSGEYYWVNGAWVPPPRVGYLWTPGYWGFNDGVYLFHTGYWGSRVGFYGGINYGYGYGGYGYYGGRWDGRVFRYNTAITRVNVNVVRNTYVDKNVIRNTTENRASFNGRGGIAARPDATQLAAARASHVPPTATQTKAVAQARTDRANAARQLGNNPTRTARVTPNGRAANLTRQSGNVRPAQSLANPSRSNGRTALARGNRRGGDRANFVRSSGRNGFRNPGGARMTRGPQVARQTRTAQPRGAQVKDNGKRH